jgi:hypothetical protein
MQVYYFTELPYHCESKPLGQQNIEELQANYHVVAGTPDTVLKKLAFSKTSETRAIWYPTVRNRVCPTRRLCAPSSCLAKK